MPRRGDIDPLELRRHLPYLSMIEPVADAGDFRFRLIGTGITERMGRDSTGKTVREAYALADADVRAWMLDVYGAVVTHKRPVLQRGTLRVVRKEYITVEALQLPLSEDGERVSLLFGRTLLLSGDNASGAQ